MIEPILIFDVIQLDHELTDRLQAAKMLQSSEIAANHHEIRLNGKVTSIKLSKGLPEPYVPEELPVDVTEISINIAIEVLKSRMPCCLILAHCREIRYNNTVFKNNQIEGFINPDVSRVLLGERLLPLYEIAEDYVTNKFSITYDKDTGKNVRMMAV